jgi:hypothetical protein
VCGFLKTFLVDRELEELSMKIRHIRFGHLVQELWGSDLIFSYEGRLSRACSHSWFLKSAALEALYSSFMKLGRRGKEWVHSTRRPGLG